MPYGRTRDIDTLVSAANEPIRFRNPKRYLSVRSGRWNWYGYYAGYSPEFVEDIIKYLQLPANASVLDPWNGIGTTTLVANNAGLDAYGFDINPALTMIARSLSVAGLNRNAIETQVQSLFKQADVTNAVDNDLLLTWFQPSSCAMIRAIENGVRQKLVVDADSLTGEAAFLYLAIFRTVRNLLRRFTSSNPTWIKEPTSPGNRVRPGFSQIMDAFTAAIEELMERDERGDLLGQSARAVKLGTSPSWNIPLPTSCIDAVVSSPPYCTRIDYAVATKPELAVLGYSPLQFKHLRQQMIGSPTIMKSTLQPRSEWGASCSSFLQGVKTHDSQASESYYLKTYLQYFDGIFRSLRELDRVLRPGGACVLVVQDSYYKDIHLNIAKIFVEMGRELNWSCELVQEYVNGKSFAGVNSRSRKYRPVCLPTESVLVMRKG